MSRRDKIISLLEKSRRKLEGLTALAIRGSTPDPEEVYELYVDLEYSVFLIKVEGRLEGMTETRVHNGMKLVDLLAISLDAVEAAKKELEEGRLMPALREARVARDGVKEAYLYLRKVKGQTASSSSERSLSPLEGPSSENRASTRP